jgi:hypothetical protein
MRIRLTSMAALQSSLLCRLTPNSQALWYVSFNRPFEKRSTQQYAATLLHFNCIWFVNHREMVCRLTSNSQDFLYVLFNSLKSDTPYSPLLYMYLIFVSYTEDYQTKVYNAALQNVSDFYTLADAVFQIRLWLLMNCDSPSNPREARPG